MGGNPGNPNFWNVDPASVLVQAVIVNPDTDVDATGVVYPAGHCVLSIPPAPWSLGWQIFCQIAVQDGGWFAASRGTLFGVGG